MNLNSVLKVVQGWVKLRGDSDNTLIGNVGDRLKVIDPGGAIPSECIAPFSAKLAETGGSNNLHDFDGSTTNVPFTSGPTTTNEVWYVTRINVSVDDTGTSKRVDFGSIAGGLTNGLLVQMDVKGTTYNNALVKNNAELISGFNTTFRGQSTAFINDANFISATLILGTPITLAEATSDLIRVVVRDDLTGLDFMQVTLSYIRVVT